MDIAVCIKSCNKLKKSTSEIGYYSYTKPLGVIQIKDLIKRRIIMFREEVKLRKISAYIAEAELNNMKSYMQGAVYCWCKNNKNDKGIPRWFAARDLFGGDNFYWETTPLFQLYQWHEENGAVDPVNMAGRDVGHLLKSVLYHDKRIFKTNKNYTREYQWTM